MLFIQEVVHKRKWKYTKYFKNKACYFGTRGLHKGDLINEITTELPLDT